MKTNRYCSILFAFLIVTTVAVCEDAEETDWSYNWDDPPEMVNPHSFYYDKVSKQMLNEEGDRINLPSSDYDKAKTANIVAESSINEISVKTNIDGTTGCAEERIFYTRLIKLLLANLHIETKDEDPIVAMVRLEITADQMEVLSNIKADQISFRDIDAIVAAIIKKPSFNFMAEAIYAMEKVADVSELILRKMLENSQAITICAIVIVPIIMVSRTAQLSRGLPICIVIQLLFVLSFLITWWQLVQEAEIKLRAAQTVYSEIPIACQPERMNMWHKFVATVYPTNDCEKYYEAMMADAKLKVTPALALSHLISTVILHPVSHIGTAISAFVTNSTADLSPIYAWMIKSILFGCIGVVIVILPLVAFGARFNIGLGPLFNFGIDCKKKRNDSIEDKSLRREPPVQIILQMPHAHAAPVISAVSESGEVQSLEYPTHAKTSKTNVEKTAICSKPAVSSKGGSKTSRESSIDDSDDVETEPLDHTSACESCRKRTPNLNIGAGDA